ncbi:MAG: hypothetical protein P1R58_02145 [bacterium]|nr:hypothetical protein [bacterium]
MPKFATAINCIDGRAQLPIIEYIKRNHAVDFVDMINAPGADGLLAANKDAARLKNIRDAVAVSVDREGSAKVVAVCGHHDCLGNPVDEAQHKTEIKRGVDQLKWWNSNLEIIGLWVNANWTVERVV